MRNNAVKEAIQTNFATIHHISGKINLANVLTKVDKYHYPLVREQIMGKPRGEEPSPVEAAHHAAHTKCMDMPAEKVLQGCTTSEGGVIKLPKGQAKGL
eukprot:15341208-Ditylum_brightwellii.AAC.1